MQERLNEKELELLSKINPTLMDNIVLNRLRNNYSEIFLRQNKKPMKKEEPKQEEIKEEKKPKPKQDFKVVIISGQERQMLHFNLAKYCQADGNKGLIFLVTAVNMLMGIVGKDKLVEDWKKQYGGNIDEKQIFERYSAFSRAVSKIENYFVGISSEKISKEDISSMRYRKFVEETYKFPYLEAVAYRMLHLLIERTQARNLSIVPEIYTMSAKGMVKRINSKLADEPEKGGEYKDDRGG